MNKADLIEQITEKSKLDKKDVILVIDVFMNTVSTALINEEKVSLMGFGNFETKERAARTGQNPRTGKRVPIPKSKVPTWKPSKKLRDLIN